MSKTISKHNTRKKEHFPYEIVIHCKKQDIPSQVRDTTLALCRAYRIPVPKITVLLETTVQEVAFRKQLLPGTYGRLVSSQYLENLFLPGTPIVNLGSCLTGFWEYDAGNPGNRKPLSSLMGLIKQGFSECQKAESYLWGIVDAGLSALKPKITTTLKRIPDAFWGCILSPLEMKCHAVSDVERSILYYSEKKTVIRLGMAGFTSCISSELDSEEIQHILSSYPEFARKKRTASGEKLYLCDRRELSRLP
jgi:hypothetical protein